MNGYLTKLKTQYLNDKGYLRLGKYPNGDTALQFFSRTGEPLATCTVNLEAYGHRPQPGNIIVKDYAENKGMLRALQEEGVVGLPIRVFSFGHIPNGAYECPLALLPTEG